MLTYGETLKNDHSVIETWGVGHFDFVPMRDVYEICVI